MDIRPNLFLIDLAFFSFDHSLMDQQLTNIIVVHILDSLHILIHLVVLACKARLRFSLFLLCDITLMGFLRVL